MCNGERTAGHVLQGPEHFNPSQRTPVVAVLGPTIVLGYTRGHRRLSSTLHLGYCLDFPYLDTTLYSRPDMAGGQIPTHGQTVTGENHTSAQNLRRQFPMPILKSVSKESPEMEGCNST